MDLQPNKTDGIYLPITNTRISASEWNQLVGSCMAFITAAGLTPDASDNEQFLNAFKTIAAGLEIVGANTNLSNLTATGEARFTTKADTDLSNVTKTGKSTSAGWAMPSSSYTGVTIGASDAIYTAPYDGWLFLRYNVNSTAVGFVNVTQNGHTDQKVYIGAAYTDVFIFTPIKAGDYAITYANLTFLQANLFHLSGQEEI